MERRSAGIIALLALAAAVVSVAAGPYLEVALLTGTAAALAAGGIGVLVLSERLRPTAATPRAVDSEILVTLRDSLASGVLGRERVLATVRSLERRLGTTGRAPPDPEQERRLLELPPAKFRAWLSEELDHLERES